MVQLIAYLKFNGNCREAMAFYKECLGGELDMQTIGESPMASQMPAEIHKNVMHSSLTKDNAVILYASDMFGPDKAVNGNSVSLSLIGTKDEVKDLFAKLSTGGQITHALKEEFFGTYGDIVDKFGISWMFQADAEQKSN